MEEELIVDVKLDTGSNEKELDKLINQITILTGETKDLQDINKTLAAEGKNLTQQYVENSKQIEINKQAMNTANNAKKSLITVMGVEDQSITGLTQRNKQLKIERDGVTTATEAGRNKIKEINAEINKNNATIKDNSSDLEKNRLSLSSVSQGIDKVIPGFDGLSSTVSGTSGLVKGATGSFNGLSTAMKVALGPIGLIIAALALVVAWLKGSEEGGDMLAKKLEQLEAIFDVLSNRAIQLGGALVKLFTGDLSGAAEAFSDATANVSEELSHAVDEAGKMADLLDELEDRELANEAAMSASVNTIKRLTIESKNKNLTEAEKIKLLQQASDLEVSTNAISMKIASDKLKATIMSIDVQLRQYDITQKANESEIEYANRIISDGRLTIDVRKKVLESVVNLNNVEGESLNIQEKLTNQIDAQNIKQQEKIDKAAEVALKKQEAEEKETADYEKAVSDRYILEATAAQKRKDLLDKQAIDDLTRMNKSFADLLKHLEDKTKAADASIKKDTDTFSKNEERKKQAVIDAYMAMGDVASDIAGKRNAIAQFQFKNEMDAIELNKRASIAAAEQKYDEQRALADKDLAAGLISEENYKAQIAHLNELEKQDKINLEKKFNDEQREIKRKAFEENKKNQIIQTGIDAAQAAVAAYRSLAPIPIVGVALGIAAAAAALLYGKKQIDNIKAQQFVGKQGGKIPGGGKWFTTGGKDHSAGGTQYYGEDGNSFELQSDEGMFVLKREAHADFIHSMSGLNQSHGGRSWLNSGVSHGALGGGIASQPSQGVDADLLLTAVQVMAESMPAPRVAVDDINTGQANVKVVEDKGILIP